MFMGHKKVTTTETYIHPDARAIRKQMEDKKLHASMKTYSVLKQNEEPKQSQ